MESVENRMSSSHRRFENWQDNSLELARLWWRARYGHLRGRSFDMMKPKPRIMEQMLICRPPYMEREDAAWQYYHSQMEPDGIDATPELLLFIIQNVLPLTEREKN